MKLYTFYSDTHTELYEDYFLKSFNDYGLNKSFELDSTLINQHKGNGAFDSEGFNSSMMDKVEILQRAAEENINKYFFTYNTWAHILEPNESTMIHTHDSLGLPSHLSWVYYSKTEPNCGNIVHVNCEFSFTFVVANTKGT